MRHKQLDLLLDADPALATKLLRGRNNNSTPLTVAASHIQNEAHAGVFRRLLQAADGVVLSTTTKSGRTAALVSDTQPWQAFVLIGSSLLPAPHLLVISA